MTNYNKMHKEINDTVEKVEETQPISNETIEEVSEVKSNDSDKVGFTKTYLNVRSAMSTESDIIEVLPTGTKVNILGSEGDWLQIIHGETFGYVLSEFIEMEN